MNNEPVAWINRKGKDGEHGYLEWDKDDEAEINIPLYTHPVKEQSNLVNIVKKHIEDLVRCVKLFRSYEMDNTADEMEIAIKELKDAIDSHPVKELTDEEIENIAENCWKTDEDLQFFDYNKFARAILRKAQEK